MVGDGEFPGVTLVALRWMVDEWCDGEVMGKQWIMVVELRASPSMFAIFGNSGLMCFSLRSLDVYVWYWGCTTIS